MKQEKEITHFAKELLAQAAVHKALSDPYRLRTVELLRLNDRTPSEVSAALGIGSNLFAHHLQILKAAGVVHETTSSGDGRRRYLQLDAAVLGFLPAHAFPASSEVLFVCTHNSARSQMASAIYAKLSGKTVASAGTQPAKRIHPLAIATARRHGFEIASSQPKAITDLPFTPKLIVTVCDEANEALPTLDVPRLHWSTPDPTETGTLKAFESAFTILQSRVAELTA